MKSGLLIYNLKAGRGTFPSVSNLLAALPPARPVEVCDATPALLRESTWVAVAGGDGTVESMASSLLDSGIPMGIIPAGTYNNFARSLHLPLDPIKACEVIRNGTHRPVDVGFANGRPFFECLGTGLDAALYPLGETIKSGRRLLWWDLFRQAYRYPRQSLTIELDRPVCQALVPGTSNESHRLVHELKHKSSNQITVSALMLVVSNGPYFGMNFNIAPEERMDDGLLTVTLFSRYSKWDLWWRFFSVAYTRKRYCPRSIAFRVANLRVSGPEVLPVHLDGSSQRDIWPISISCLPQALHVFRDS